MTSSLSDNLKQFTGTEHYYKWSQLFPNFVMTDGAQYLAKEAGAYWLFDLIASHVNGHADTFVTATLEWQGSRWLLSLDDGNGNVWATQIIEYSDFPIPQIKLYAVWDTHYWVIMIPSEY